MINKALLKLAKVQERKPVVVLLVMLVITLFFLSHALNLQTDASFDSMYPQDSSVITLKELVASEFGSTDTMFVLFQIDETIKSDSRVDDIRDPRVLEAMRDLTITLRDDPTVSDVFSIEKIISSQGELPQTLTQSKGVFSQLGEIKQGFVSSDYTIANMILSVNIPRSPGSIEKIENNLQEKITQSSKPVGLKIILTGQPTLMNRIMNLLINDNLVTILIAIGFVFLFLTYFFRSIRISSVTIVPIIVTLIWLAGTLVLLDIRITMMTAAVGAMMVGMSADYSIHLTHAFHEGVRKAKKRVTTRTVHLVGGALFASALTTMAGFIAMLFGISPSSKVQGLVLALGIAYAFLTTIITLPALLVLQRKHMYKPLQEIIFKIKKGKDEKGKKDLKQRFLRGIAAFQIRHAKKMLIAIVAITILIIPGAALLRFDTDNANWLPQKDEVIESFNTIQNAFGGTEQMNLLVMENPLFSDALMPLSERKDLRNRDVLTSIAKIDQSLEALDYIEVVQSPTDEIKKIVTTLPENKHQLREMVSANPQVAQYFSKDFSLIRMTIITDSFGDPSTNEPTQHFYEIIDEINTIGYPGHIVIRPQGGMADFIELEENLGSDVGKTTMIGFLFVILIAAFIYRSFLVGFLAFIPIIFAMIWTVSVMGLIGLPFTVLTSGLLAIVMGMGIDFSIHLIHGVKALTKKGENIVDAIKETVSSSGEAILAATLTTVIGFSSLALASLLVTQRLGYTLAIAIAMSFFACILIVPSVLIIEDTIKKKKKKSMEA